MSRVRISPGLVPFFFALVMKEPFWGDRAGPSWWVVLAEWMDAA